MYVFIYMYQTLKAERLLVPLKTLKIALISLDFLYVEDGLNY